MARLRAAVDLAKQAGKDWWEDKAPRLAAALAFYTLFALAPLIIVVIAIAGLAFGSTPAAEAIARQADQLFGSGGGEFVRGLLDSASERRSGLSGAVVGTLAFLVGASGVFVQLQDALNTVWEVRPKPIRSWSRRLMRRLRAFAVVMALGFLLLASLIVSAGLAAMATAGRGLPGADIVWAAVDFAVSLAVVTLLFALLFRYLPDAEVRWSNVWWGAVTTSALFAVGKLAIGVYLGQATAASRFGAASSVAVVLLWVYYCAQILLYGAELTQAHAQLRGQAIVPKPHAEAVTEDARANEGLGSST